MSLVTLSLCQLVRADIYRNLRQTTSETDQLIPALEWFARRGWQPFTFQREVWQAYLDSQSGLIHAATGTGKTYAAERITLVDVPRIMPLAFLLALAPFVLRHHPKESSDGYVLAGHLHPAVRLRGSGRQHMRLACFCFGARIGVLPAFGGFTGSALVSPGAGDRVFALTDDQVLAMT